MAAELVPPPKPSIVQQLPYGKKRFKVNYRREKDGAQYYREIWAWGIFDAEEFVRKDVPEAIEVRAEQCTNRYTVHYTKGASTYTMTITADNEYDARAQCTRQSEGGQPYKVIPC